MKKYFSLSYVLLIGLGMIWGSSFILIKRGLLAYTPLQVGAYRMFAAGVVLLPIFLFYFKQTKKSDFKWFFVSGLLGNGLPAIMFAVAQTHLSSSVAGVLNALTPLFALLIGLVAYKLPVDKAKIAGVVIGLFGALSLILFGDQAEVRADIFYSLLLVLASFFYGINVNLIKEKFGESRPMVIAAFPIVFMAIPCFFILLFTGFFDRVSMEGQAFESLGYITLLALFGTAFSLIAFNRLIQMTNAVFASLTTYIIPVIALMWGILDGEEIGIIQVIGLGLILAGVLLVRKK